MSLPTLFAQAQPWIPPDPAGPLRGLLAVALVLAVLAAAVWAARRGLPGWSRSRPGAAIRVETAVSLGDRRSLVVVAVEGRRLLLGVTPGQVTLVTGLQDTPGAFDDALQRRLRDEEDPA